MADKFDSSRFIKLANFSGGWIWVSHVNEHIKKLLPYLENISKEKLKEIWAIIGAEEKTWTPYEDTKFCVTINPLPDFMLLLIFNEGDEEFPSELKVFYEKKSLSVPTEDAYVFTEIYLEMIRQIAKSENILIIETFDIISLGDLADKHPDLEREKILQDIIGQRFKPIKYIDLKTAKSIADNLKIEFITDWKHEKTEWALEFKLFQDLSIYYVKYWENSSSNLKIYYHVSVLKYNLEIIINFSWLFLNAIIREGRKLLGDKMPKISKFL
ncbi:MAG: DUF3786 domain-containing protein [Candidatus Hodarchaeota archaeon]